MAIEKMDKIALTPRECSELCGLHINTVRRLISEKKIPAVHLTRKILISKPALLRWLEGQSPGEMGPKV